MSEPLSEAFGFRTDQRVRMLVECRGHDHNDIERTAEAGAIGTIEYIERMGAPQGVNFTVAIAVRASTIVNCFDEMDGPPSRFFEPA